MTRDTRTAIAASIAVVVVVAAGLVVMGGPGKQRLIQSDLGTLRALAGLAQQNQIRLEECRQWAATQSRQVPSIGDA